MRSQRTRGPAGIFGRRHWIPPGAFAFGQLAHGASWLVAIIAALTLLTGSDGWQLAWIHLVVLGWFTTIAFGILLHALPAFTDGVWKAETLARWSILGFAAGVFGMVVAFAAASPWLLYAGILCALFAGVYILSALITLAKPMLLHSVEGAVARALAITLGLLLATVILGVLLVLMRVGVPMPWWIVRVPFIHATLGTVGWLCLLVFGVSLRTLRPITGAAPGTPWMHIATGTLTLLAIVGLAVGAAEASVALLWLGAGCFGAGALLYVADVVDRLRRATVRHRLPQGFVIASILWLIVALGLGGAALAGDVPPSAYLFVLLIGWVGQMVNAHGHHIGVRLIATIYRGEDDQTPPERLLSPLAGWMSFVLFQVAIAVVAIGLLCANAGLTAFGSAIGFLGWCAMSANMLHAKGRALQSA